MFDMCVHFVPTLRFRRKDFTCGSSEELIHFSLFWLRSNSLAEIIYIPFLLPRVGMGDAKPFISRVLHMGSGQSS